MMNQSDPGENFVTRAFASEQEARTWLAGGD
jgi:hypothetical protein